MGLTSRSASAGAADAAHATTSGHAQEVAHGLQAQQQQQRPSHQPQPRQADSSAAARLPAGSTQQLVEGHQAQGQGDGQTLGPPGSGGRGEAAAAAGRGRVRSPPALQGKHTSSCMCAAVCCWSGVLLCVYLCSDPARTQKQLPQGLWACCLLQIPADLFPSSMCRPVFLGCEALPSRLRGMLPAAGAEPSGGTQGSDQSGGTRRLSGSPTAASSSSPRQGWQSHVLADGGAAASSSRATGAQAQAEQGVGRAVAEPTPGRLAQVGYLAVWCRAVACRHAS